MDPMQQQAYAQMLTQMGPSSSAYSPGTGALQGLNDGIQRGIQLAKMLQTMRQQQQATDTPAASQDPAQPGQGVGSFIQSLFQFGSGGK